MPTLFATIKDVIKTVNEIIKPAGNRSSIEENLKQKYNMNLNLTREQILSKQNKKYERIINMKNTDNVVKDVNVKDVPLPYGHVAEKTHKGNCAEFSELTLIKLLQNPICRQLNYYICSVPDKRDGVNTGHDFIVALPRHNQDPAIITRRLQLEKNEYIGGWIIDSWGREIYPIGEAIMPKKLDSSAAFARKQILDDGGIEKNGKPMLSWDVKWYWNGQTLNEVSDENELPVLWLLECVGSVTTYKHVKTLINADAEKQLDDRSCLSNDMMLEYKLSVEHSEINQTAPLIKQSINNTYSKFKTRPTDSTLLSSAQPLKQNNQIKQNMNVDTAFRVRQTNPILLSTQPLKPNNKIKQNMNVDTAFQVRQTNQILLSTQQFKPNNKTKLDIKSQKTFSRGFTHNIDEDRKNRDKLENKEQVKKKESNVVVNVPQKILEIQRKQLK